jgi:hypothetical protein
VFYGGAILNGAEALITNSTFTGNEFEEGIGGTIGNFGTMVIRNCTIEESQAFRAGAIYNEGTLSVFATTISGSFAGIGGGVYNKGELVLTNSAVTDNAAIVAGGGIYTCCGGRTTLIRTSVAGNTPDNTFQEP